VFAWLDSGNRRYAVYAVVYLAPYLRFYSIMSFKTFLVYLFVFEKLNFSLLTSFAQCDTSK
jgi:hypothetical protein